MLQGMIQKHKHKICCDDAVQQLFGDLVLQLCLFLPKGDRCFFDPVVSRPHPCHFRNTYSLVCLCDVVPDDWHERLKQLA